MPEKNIESDLGIKAETSFVIANLVNLEEHLMMTIATTQNKDYLPVLGEIRKLRAEYMKEFIGNQELSGQLWCCIKHILGTAYRLSEVATKNIALERMNEALKNLKDSKDLFELSFAILQIDKKNGTDGQPKGENQGH